MIELLKQTLEALEDVGVLTDREWQAVHKNKANELRQAIAELESQEPVGTAGELFTSIALERLDFRPSTKIYTTSPQRTWVGLTDKEIEAIWKIAMFTDYGIGAELSNQPFVHYARAIEAKLKEKNNE